MPLQNPYFSQLSAVPHNQTQPSSQYPFNVRPFQQRNMPPLYLNFNSPTAAPSSPPPLPSYPPHSGNITHVLCVF